MDLGYNEDEKVVDEDYDKCYHSHEEENYQSRANRLSDNASERTNKSQSGAIRKQRLTNHQLMLVKRQSTNLNLRKTTEATLFGDNKRRSKLTRNKSDLVDNDQIGVSGSDDDVSYFSVPARATPESVRSIPRASDESQGVVKPVVMQQTIHERTGSHTNIVSNPIEN